MEEPSASLQEGEEIGVEFREFALAREIAAEEAEIDAVIGLYRMRYFSTPYGLPEQLGGQVLTQAILLVQMHHPTPIPERILAHPLVHLHHDRRTCRISDIPRFKFRFSSHLRCRISDGTTGK
jgi:hypothetical protein